jgi:tetratricopeptide (TPR) repeat protein
MRRLCLPLLVVLLALTSAAQEDEAWSEGKRVRGTVLDAQGRPLPGARVTLTREDGGDGPPAATSNTKGKFSIQGATPGAWNLTVEAEDHVTSYGRVTVRASGPTPALRVQLRSLDEVSAFASEGNPSTIRGWLERGSSLLDQGLYAEARSEFEKALRELPPSEHPQVLQAVARTWYLEGDTETAIETLQQAVRLAPRNEALRELLRQVGLAVNDPERVERFLAEVDEATATAPGPAPGTGGDEAQRSFEVPDHPRIEPTPHRVGRYRTSFDKRTPLSGLGEYVKRSGIPMEAILREDPEALDLDLADEVYEVYVPDAYAPDSTFGLFVWVSPTPYGGFEHPETLAVLDRFRLIAVGADSSGNTRPRWDRYRLALEAAHNAKRLYDIDPSRVFVGGYSGGGRMASGLHVLYPEVFRGGFYFYGCDHFVDMPLPDRPGAHWTAGFPRPARPILKQLKQEHRFVLLTGSRDFNRLQTLATYESLEAQGFRHVTYLEIPEASHYTRVGPEWLTRAFRALDGDESP